MPAQPLSNVRVIELADEQAEYCGLAFAGLGAEVIKVEPPTGNETRKIGPFFGEPDPERSLFFWNYNRGKRSVVIDLADPLGVDQLLGLLEDADVFLESKPGPLRDRDPRLDSQALRKRFPSLIVARMTPFGDTGPWRDFRARISSILR